MTTLKQRIGRVMIPLFPISRRTFDILRMEFNAAATMLLNRVLPWRVLNLAKLKRRTNFSLNVGSGGKGIRGEWLNLDIASHLDDIQLAWDVRRALPFTDGSAKRIFAEHVLEHLDFRHDMPKVLKEFMRILQPGGRFRIVVPDCERYVDAYITRSAEKWAALGMETLPGDMPTHMAMVNHVFHQEGEHLFGYDFETMRWLLSVAGFTDIRKMSYGVSADPDLCIDRLEHANYSMYVEARKPENPMSQLDAKSLSDGRRG